MSGGGNADHKSSIKKDLHPLKGRRSRGSTLVNRQAIHFTDDNGPNGFSYLLSARSIAPVANKPSENRFEGGNVYGHGKRSQPRRLSLYHD